MTDTAGVSPSASQPEPTGDSKRVEEAAARTGEQEGGLALLRTSGGRNLGLVLALVLVCIAGFATSGSQFANIDNALTILRLASVIGVVSIGMTFVITGGGIDLSVGAIVALASVWCTTLATQRMAEDTHWSMMVFSALAVGLGCGLVNGLLIVVRRRGAVHRHAGHARSGPRLRRDPGPAPDPDRHRLGVLGLLPPGRPRHPDAGPDLRRGRPRSAGSCSTGRPSADAPSRSAATPRQPASPASTSSATP